MWFTTKTLPMAVLLVLGNLTIGNLMWGYVLSDESPAFEVPRITILVFDQARLKESILAAAEQHTADIFREAGVETTWRDCVTRSGKSQDSECHQIPDASHFVVSIVPRAHKRAPDVFGISFLGQDGTGNYADIFVDAITSLYQAGGTDEASILGAVTAHELGHLLLGLNSHSYAGIMCARWEPEQLRRIGMGSLGFDHEQARRMHQRIWDGQRNTQLQLARTENCGVKNP